MSKVFLMQRLNVNAFLQGKNPQFVEHNQYIGSATIAGLQIGCVFRGDERFQGTATLLCDDKSVPADKDFCLQRYEESMLTGVMLHVFDTHEGASRVFTMDAQNGNIDWNALRTAVQHYTEHPHSIQHVHNPRGVDESQIDVPMALTHSAALAIITSQPEWSREDADAFLAAVGEAFAQSNAQTEHGRMLSALSDALTTMGGKWNNVNVGAILHDYTSRITSPLEQARWDFSHFAGPAASMLRTHWAGYYEISQREGFSPEISATLATLKTAQGGIDETRNTERGAFKLSPFNIERCTALRDAAAQKALEQGISQYEVGAIRNHSFVKDTCAHPGDPASLYAFIAELAYGQCVPEQPHAEKEFQMCFNGTRAMTLNERLDAAIQTVNQRMVEKYGVSADALPTAEAVQQAMQQLTYQRPGPSSYFAIHIGDLPKNIIDQCQTLYLRQIVCEGALNDIKDPMTCAAALYKAATTLSMEVAPGTPAHTALEQLRASTTQELQHSQSQSSDDRDTHDDIGDDTVGDDAL